MISVIIPTLWLAEGFMDRLMQLSAIEEVAEIILIDNSENPPDLVIPKLVHIREYQNTYVNPAWNKGVALARHDRLCIMNDDINFENDLFSKVEPHIREENGMIGLYNFDGIPYYDDGDGGIEFKIVDSRGWRGMGYACLFFIHRRRYKPIPLGLKVWFGDDYLFRFNGAPNYMMQNINVWGATSVTSRLPVFDSVKISDSEIYSEILKNA